MKFLFIILSLLCSIEVLAQRQKQEINDQRIDFFPLAMQARYQDKSDQTHDITIWNSFAARYSFKDFSFDIEFNQYKEESGTAALNFENKTTNYLLSAGYRIFSLGNEQIQKAAFVVRASGYIGQNLVTVNRTLNGTVTTEESDPDLVLGLGAVATGYFWKFLVAETDIRFLYARNANPQWMPVQSLRLGVGFSF